MRNLQQNSFRKFHLERNYTILKMAKIDPKQPKFAQNKGTRGPNLTNNPSNSISKLSLIQWNNSFLNLSTHKNRVCKGPPFDFHQTPLKGVTEPALRVQTWHHIFSNVLHVPKHHTIKIKMVSQTSHLTHSPTGLLVVGGEGFHYQFLF